MPPQPFPTKLHLKNEHRNYIVMTRHFSWFILRSAFNWVKQISLTARPITRTTQIWVVTCRQYGICSLIPQTSFWREASGVVVKCKLFYQAKKNLLLNDLCHCYLKELPACEADGGKDWVLVRTLVWWDPATTWLPYTGTPPGGGYW